MYTLVNVYTHTYTHIHAHTHIHTTHTHVHMHQPFSSSAYKIYQRPPTHISRYLSRCVSENKLNAPSLMDKLRNHVSETECLDLSHLGWAGGEGICQCMMDVCVCVCVCVYEQLVGCYRYGYRMVVCLHTAGSVLRVNDDNPINIRRFSMHTLVRAHAYVPGISSDCTRN